MTSLFPLVFSGCAHHAAPLPAAPPEHAPAAYTTDPVEAPRGSPYVEALGREVLRDAAELGLAVTLDPALGRVADRVAWSIGSGRTVPAAALQEWTADAGVPHVVAAVQAETLPRGRLPDDVVARLVVDGALTGEPALVGLGAYTHGRQTVATWVVARPRLVLEAPLPPEGGTLRIRPLAPFERVGVVSVDARGLSEQIVTLTGSSPSALELSVRDPGWHEIVGITGPSLQTIGLVRVGPPIPTAPEPPPDPREAVRQGLIAMRARLGLPPMELVEGDPSCDQRGADVLGGVEVTRDQHCSTVPLFGVVADPWDVIVRRPMMMRTVADYDMDVLQVGVDTRQVRIRTASRFERLSPEQMEDRLQARLAERWPELERHEVPELDALAADWAAGADPLSDPAMSDVAARLDAIAQAWTPEQYLRVVCAAQTVDKLMRYVPTEYAVTDAAVGVVLGAGRSGEPMYYAAITLALAPADPPPRPTDRPDE